MMMRSPPRAAAVMKNSRKMRNYRGARDEAADARAARQAAESPDTSAPSAVDRAAAHGVGAARALSTVGQRAAVGTGNVAARTGVPARVVADAFRLPFSSS